MSELRLSITDGPTPWQGTEKLTQEASQFSFALLSDRTGLSKRGVFERAVEVLNLMQPRFVIQVGDCIEGYSRDRAKLDHEWSEFERLIERLDAPLFRIPGNHDVSNDLMRDIWAERFGALHYHFVYRDTLFVHLDTQDPPLTLEDFENLRDLQGAAAGEGDIDMERLQALYDESPRKFAEGVERSMNIDGPQSAKISEQQVEWAMQVIREHADVRWTFLIMHIPTWQQTMHPGLQKMVGALDGRPYTAFAGHIHNYQLTRINGMDHIRLGPSGGAFITTREEGNFDHVTWVSIGEGKPRVANIVIDGVLGEQGGVFSPRPMF